MASAPLILPQSLVPFPGLTDNFYRFRQTTGLPAPEPKILEDGKEPPLPIDRWFGDIFDRLWKSAEITTTVPKGDFLAQTRAPNPQLPAVDPTYKKMVSPLVPMKGNLMPSNSSYMQGIARDWSLVPEIPRVNAFGFRGDSRDPVSLEKAGGFLPPSTRSDDTYITGTLYEQFRSYLTRRFQMTLSVSPQELLAIVKAKIPDPKYRHIWVEYACWREIVRSEEAHLGRMIAEQTAKSYISTTYNYGIAKRFVKSGNFIYLLRLKGAFVIPPKGQHLWTQQHQENELAQPGPVPWDDVVGFADRTDRSEPKLYFRPEFARDNSAAFADARVAMSF